ncbi:translation elongation factor-like protein [archaeon]|nr:translation elongation factor-like protein [archaeon]
MAEKKQIGTITHYFVNIGVGVIELTDTIKEGDTIEIQGATTSFQQKAESMQINKKPVKAASKGQEIGIKLMDRVREGDKVFKIP